MRRRTFVGLAGGVVLAGCVGGDEPAGGGPNAPYGDWFEDVGGYDGEADLTGRERVGVAVGADDGLSFDPVAVRVSPGTTVRWEWTGRGGRHNVVARSGAFESEYHDAEGATFEHAFGAPALFQYFCEPHRDFGMKGGVRVVEP